MVDIRAPREANELGEVNDMVWFRPPENVGYGLTKFVKCKAVMQLMDTDKRY